MSDFNPSEANLEELVTKRQQMKQAIEEIETGRKVIDEEIMHRFKEQGVNAKVVGHWGISIVRRVSFGKVKMEVADGLGAIKSAIDTSKLKQLFDKGVEVAGAEEYFYPLFREIKEE